MSFKKLAVMGSGKGSNFLAISEFFKNKPVEIVCISDIEDSLILKKAIETGIKGYFVKFEDTEKFFTENKFDMVALAGYMRILPEIVLEKSTFINLHPSLLPSFKGKNAIAQAFEAGVKVTGITIHYAEKEVDSGKIIAQYPIFVEPWMNLTDITDEIHKLEHKLYPMVLEDLLFERVIEYSNTGKPDCSGGCGGCGKH